MRDLEEIKKTTGLVIQEIDEKDGFAGTFYKMIFKNGKYVRSNNYEDNLNYIFSWGMGWEHLSISTPVKCPTWEQMQQMKEIFWRDDECCMQLHPKKEDYVNNHPYCLHIWKPIDQEIPTPPLIMVGIPGVTPEERNAINFSWKKQGKK
jgi:hypothetical protein